jgi:hypothetical protein
MAPSGQTTPKYVAPHAAPWAVADSPQIEDDAQENEVNEDAMSDIRSPDTDEIVSPASHGARVQVWLAQRMLRTLHLMRRSPTDSTLQFPCARAQTRTMRRKA